MLHTSLGRFVQSRRVTAASARRLATANQVRPRVGRRKRVKVASGKGGGARAPVAQPQAADATSGGGSSAYRRVAGEWKAIAAGRRAQSTTPARCGQRQRGEALDAGAERRFEQGVVQGAPNGVDQLAVLAHDPAGRVPTRVGGAFIGDDAWLCSPLGVIATPLVFVQGSVRLVPVRLVRFRLFLDSLRPVDRRGSVQRFVSLGDGGWRRHCG